MAANEILRFAETDTGTNLLTQSEYSTDTQRPIGNQPGVARAKLVNKALRQTSAIAAGIAKYIADRQSVNITDSLTPDVIATALQNALSSSILTNGSVTTPILADNVLSADAAGRAKMADNFVTLAKLADGAVTTAKLADGAVTTAKWASSNGQLAGMRNKIINGKMDISERGTSFAAIASGAYSLDRWQFGNSSSAVVTISQQQDTPPNNEFLHSLRLTVTTADASIAAAEVAILGQPIEGYNIRDLIGRTFTFSFWVRSSKTGIHCVALKNQDTSNRSYIGEYIVNVANTWEYKVITVNGGLPTAGTWNYTNGLGLQVRFALAVGSNQQTTAGAWQTGNFLASANQVNCLDTVGNIFAITGVQLEPGSVATPFEHRPFGAELALCQRYYTNWVGDSSGSGFRAIGSGYVTGTATDATILIPLSAALRTIPTVAFSGNISVLDSTLTGTVSSIVASYAPSNQSFWLTVRTGTTMVTGRAAIMYTQNAATNKFELSSEL